MRRAAVIGAVAAAMVVAGALALARVGEEPGALSNRQALLLGVVQGLTELLPVSSSGHLILVPWLADWTYLEQHDEFNQTFDVALHLGTLVAVVAYFRHDLARVFVAFVRSLRHRRLGTSDERIAWAIALATLPAAGAGAAGESSIVEHLGEPWQIAILLAVFGGVLWLADRRPERRSLEELSVRSAVAIGLAQVAALMPGVSRSGITISAGRFLGLDRESAARFSFLLLVPITLGAVLFKGVTDVLPGNLPPGWVGPFLVGGLAAAVSGFAAIWALLGYVRRHDYSLFVLYRLALAAAVLFLIASGVRQATF